jgi:cell division septation protein DedD
MVNMAIPASIAIGLLVAVVYLGMRIVSARHHAAAAPPAKQAAVTAPVSISPPTPVESASKESKAKAEEAAATKAAVPAPKDPATTQAAQAPVPAVAAKTPGPAPAVKPVRKSDGSLSLITPQHGETYLQLAALTPETVLKYSDELRAQQLEPSIAPGPVDSKLVRVLVGPFPDAVSLAAAKERLNASKIEWIIRAY